MKKSLLILMIMLIMVSMTPFMTNKAFAASTLYGIAYDSGGPSSFYKIDPSTGAGTFVGSIGYKRCSAMDTDASGTVWAVCNGNASDDAAVIKINPNTGAGTLISFPPETHSFGNGINPGNGYSDMSFRNSDGDLYVYLEPGDGVGKLDPNTGLLTELGPSNPLGFAGNGIAFSSGDILFHGNDFELNSLDQASGSATQITPLNFFAPADDFPRLNAMDFDPSTGDLYASLQDGIGGFHENYLVTVDPVSGDVTIIDQTVDGLDAIAFALEPRQAIGGTLLPIDKTALLLAGAQSTTLMIPLVLSLVGIGMFVVSRKFGNF